MLRNSPLKLHRALTDQSLSIKSRKRLLSEHGEDLSSVTNDNKRMKEEFIIHESLDTNNTFALYTRRSSCSPCFSTSLINGYSDSTMFLCPTKPVLSDINDHEQQKPSIYLTSSQLSTYIISGRERENHDLLIIDCGIPFRHNERRVMNSLLLNVTDRLSRKRLATRGLKSFLDSDQLDRFDQSGIIVLYDDSIHFQSQSCTSSIVLSPSMKCLLEEIQRCGANKTIHILQSTFDEFAQQYPQHCEVFTHQFDEMDEYPPASPDIDVHSILMSEIFPGLYLGSENDAKDRNQLEQYQIGIVINISTDIPCYYEEEKAIEYRRISCLDSCSENILEHFDSTFEYMKKMIEEKKKNILVHCYAGISRSPSFVIGYLMKYLGKTFEQARTMTRAKRGIINPNLNFLAQLTRYEQNLKMLLS